MNQNESIIVYAVGLVVGVAVGMAFGWAIFAPAAKRKPCAGSSPRSTP